jgi:DNA-binding CsgD family transcriptional regulator
MARSDVSAFRCEVFDAGNGSDDEAFWGVGESVEKRPMRLRKNGAQRETRIKLNKLTRRELEVLTWVAQGKSAWEIGEILQIAKRTVDEHAQTAVRKLDAANRVHAVAIAVRDRMIEI